MTSPKCTLISRMMSIECLIEVTSNYKKAIIRADPSKVIRKGLTLEDKTLRFINHCRTLKNCIKLMTDFSKISLKWKIQLLIKYNKDDSLQFYNNIKTISSLRNPQGDKSQSIGHWFHRLS